MRPAKTLFPTKIKKSSLFNVDLIFLFYTTPIA